MFRYHDEDPETVIDQVRPDPGGPVGREDA